MNDGYTYREVIKTPAAGERLDAYLSRRYRHATLSEWRGHIVAGRVRLDDAVVAVDAVLCAAQTLDWHRPPWTEPDAPLAFEILYQDADLLVVSKPAGLPTMHGGGFLQHTLVHQLSLVVPGAAPAHRLGRWTSGAVLCGRTRGAARSFGKQFAARTVHKRYRALASGQPSQSRFDIDVPIGPVPYAPLGTLHAAHPEGRHAASTVTVVEQRAGACLCDVTIATGRPHQIRIHLAAMGHPLVGDPLYAAGGRPAPSCTAVPGDPGYLLHAAEIAFDHPRTGERLTVLAPPPQALNTEPR